jgi:hypothetical protein
MNLPALLPGWRWLSDGPGHHVACLLTNDVDCFVSCVGGSVRISTGIAPVEIVAAVIAANLPARSA